MYKRGRKSEHVPSLELYAIYVVQQVKIVLLHKSHLKPKIEKKKKPKVVFIKTISLFPIYNYTGTCQFYGKSSSTSKLHYFC